VFLVDSYAKNGVHEDGDVGFLVSTEGKGLFYGLVEEYCAALYKRVDALGLEQFDNSLTLGAEILKEGIRIYG